MQAASPRSVLAILAILLGATFVVIAEAQQAEVPQQQQQLEVSPTKNRRDLASLNKVSLKIRTPAATRIGEPCLVVLQLYNGNAFPVVVQYGTKLMVISLVVTLSDGTRAEYTELGSETFEPPFSDMWISGASRHARPQETAEWEIDLAKYFELKRGRCLIQAELDVVSNTNTGFRAGRVKSELDVFFVD